MKLILILLSPLIWVTGFCAESPLELVKDGVPSATIVLSEKPTAGAQLAAYELQHVIRLMTGAELPMVRNESQIRGIPLYVGESPGTVRRNLKCSDFGPEEYTVRFFPDAIVMMGSDDPEYGKVNYNNPQTYPRLEQNLHASLYAVYDFLEQFCDVRFYLPGDLGIAFTPGKTLAIRNYRDIRRKPFMSAMRNVNFCDPDIPGFRDKPRDLALLKHRWRMATNYGMANHNTMSLFYRYWGPANPKHKALANLFIEKRPEYFAQGYDGKYSGFMPWAYPGDPDIPSQVCSTNPDVIRILAGQAVNAYRGGENPGSTYPHYRRISGMPFTYPMLFEDNNFYCKCKRCEASLADKPQAERKAWRYFNFVNAIAGEAAKSEPGAGIGAGVYSIPYVERIPLHKNLSIQMMLGIHAWYLPGVQKHHQEFYQAWKKKAGNRPVTLWTYMLAPCWDARRFYKYNQFFPGFYPEATVRIFRRFTEEGVNGWFCETFLEFNFLEIFLASKLCDNPQFNAEKELEEFFSRYFGNAAKPMRQYYKEVEDTFWNPENYPAELRNRQMGMLVLGAHTDRVNWALGTPERLAKLDALFREAGKLAANDVERARLNLFENRIHRQMMEGRKKFEQRESVRSVPVPKLVVPMLSKAGDKIDWSRSECVRNFKTLFGKEDATQTEFRIGHDHENLYLSYCETGAPPEHVKAKNDPWLNSIEIFVGKTVGYPFHHIVVTPDGIVANYLHKEVNGIVSYGKIPLPAKIVNRQEKDGWEFQLSIPLKSLLPDGQGTVRAGDELYLNVMRSRTGGPALAWSPTFDESYLRSLYRMGRIRLAGAKPSAGFAIQEDFTKIKRLDERKWRIPNHAAKSGHVTLEKEGLHFTGTTFIVSEQLFSASSGNEIIINIAASGTGKGYAGICGYQQLPGETRKEIAYQNQIFELKEQADNYRLTLSLKDAKNAKMTHIKLIMGPIAGATMTVNQVNMKNR